MPRIEPCATDPRYWDCECKAGYIHKKSVGKYCRICGAVAADQPDSRKTEIKRLYKQAKDTAVTFFKIEGPDINLKKEAKTLDNLINGKADCFGISDLRRFSAVRAELVARGYGVEEYEDRLVITNP